MRAAAGLIVCKRQAAVGPNQFRGPLESAVVAVVHPDFETRRRAVELGTFSGGVVYRACGRASAVLDSGMTVDVEGMPVPTVQLRGRGGPIYTLGTVAVDPDSAVEILTYCSLRLRANGQTLGFSCFYDPDTKQLLADVGRDTVYPWGWLRGMEEVLAVQQCGVTAESRVFSDGS